jgi:hypothetical protein
VTVAAAAPAAPKTLARELAGVNIDFNQLHFM